jgi:hypothetical protein
VHDDPATGRPGVFPATPDDGTDVDAVQLAPAPAPGDDRSANASTCPFLRAIDEDGVLGQPVEAPDPANRCAALREAVPQSLRQQELVCLSSGHVNCPRYLRGSVGTGEPLRRRPGTRTVTPAIVAALAVLVLAFLLSLGFVVANGGLVLTAAAAPPSAAASGAVLGEVETSPPTAAPVPTATPVPTPSPIVTPSPSPTAIPTPSATATVTPTPSPTPPQTAKPTSKPKSGRYALLKPCPDQPNCYIYVIRSGDNLYSIANYFGVSYSTVRAWNPWTRNGLQVGRGLRIPPPTR